MKLDKAGDARAVGEHIADQLPEPWSWEARGGGIAIGTRDDFANGGSSWVYIHWGRSGRWVYLIERLLQWALDEENGYRQMLYQPKTSMFVGYGWQQYAATTMIRLVREYIAATDDDVSTDR